ncbi:hypothetical protein [Aquabacterium sp.]|uniref:hypothetical protein n=1 Tax=Aquabacterium sp. TaxID=1872578 RepID=UPI0037851DDE
MNNENPHLPVDTAPSGFARFLILLLLVFAVAGFGLVTLCGGVFTIASLGGGEYIGGAWVMSVPSLLIGGVLCWLCARQFLRFLRRKP